MAGRALTRLQGLRGRLNGLGLWVRAYANVVLRRDSLRRQANSIIDASLGSRGRAAYVWNYYPRVTTFAVALAAVVLVLALPWSYWVARWLQIVAKTSSLIAVTVGLWGVEAILFSLTAAITALLVNISANPDERSLLMERYRSKAFDAVAAVSIFTIFMTGDALRQMLRAEVLNFQAIDAYVRSSLLFVLDLLALTWLLFYSHRLITRAARERRSHLLQLLRDSVREVAMQEVSGALLEAWGPSRGLATLVSGVGFQANAGTVRAPRAAYLYDVALDRLELRLRSLTHLLSMQPPIKAQAQMRLNADVPEDTPLVAIAPADMPHGSHLLSALRWKRQIPEDSFALALGALRDSSAVAARNGLLADFNAHLAELQALQTEVFRLSGGTQRLTHRWLTHLVGWPPTVLLRNALHRLGQEVLEVESTFVIGAWLYFPQKLLRETREYADRDLGPIFVVWEQAAARGRVPQEWNFWLRLSEYTNSLNVALEAAGNAEAVRRVGSEAAGFLFALRNMIVRLETTHFAAISKAVERIGGHFLTTWSTLPAAADSLGVAKHTFANEFFNYKRVFWLGYAGWLFRKLAQQGMPASEATKQWESIREQFNTLDQLWGAWRVLGDNDPFKWDFEDSLEWKARAEAQGLISWGGSPEPFASATVPFILLGLNLAPGSVLAPDYHARALLDTEIQPYITQMLADGDPKWEPFVGRLADRPLTVRMNQLTQRILDSAAAAAQAPPVAPA